MTDYSILFFSILMILVFLYRIVLSILFLCKKKYLLDEKYFIALFYLSLVGTLILFTNWLVAGYILVGILPIILTLYVSLSKHRVYWIKNGYQVTESTFINAFIEYNKKYQDTVYRLDRINFSRKVKEKRSKISFSNIDYKEKENLLEITKKICKENTIKGNKRELGYIFGYLFLILLFTFFILIVLFS